MCPSPLIIAHRGASAVAPENTIAAFREAIAAGADGIEFDVRLTRDGVPVIIHDSTLHRTAGLPGRIGELTWAELRQVDVGSWFAAGRKLPLGSFATETIPRLEELFTLFETNHATLYLEMKCDSPSEHVPLAEACCQLIENYSFSARVMIECFDLSALEVVRNIDSEIKTVPLFQQSLLPDQRVIEKALAIGASALALHYRLAREPLVQKARDAGLHVAVWTVDDPAWIERARSSGIEALITNDPAAMLARR